jgi:polyribonucleotide nucleotidyltransferase
MMSKALQIIGDITASPEVGKTYLGKVVRLADFGAFVEIFPGTDGLLHISEIAEHRIKDVRDELHEGDQILVKVLALEGNRIKLSRKAILKEQRAKMGGQSAEVQPTGDGAGQHVPISTNGGESITIEGGADFEEGDDEPNFNRAEGEPAHAAAAGEGQGQRREGGGRPGGGGGGRRRRHHGRRGGGGDRGPGGGGRR